MERRVRLQHLCVVALALFAALPALALDDEPPPLSPPGSFFEPGQFVHHDGATLYRAICQGCHMPDARGAEGAGRYPALAANPKLASAPYPTLTVLHGRRGMPALGIFLSDAQVAEVVNFVRSHFGNQYTDPVTAADVAKLRAPTGARP
jgi:mono/diheme cytochrome c family protein